MSIHNVVLAGASGGVGPDMLQGLIDGGFKVTVLARAESSAKYPDTVTVANVDYNDTASMAAALKDQDAVVSTLAAAAIATEQKNLIDAAIQAGVRRFIPSEYGCDLDNEITRQMPVFGPKVGIQDYLEEQTKGTKTSYTSIYNNTYLDFGVALPFLIDAKGKNMELLDGGRTPTTITSMGFAAKATVSVLKHLEQTKNRSIRIHGATVTQRDLLALVQGIVGEDGWTITEKTSEQLEKESLKNLQEAPANVPAWLFGLLKRGIYGPGLGGDYSKNNDNEVLGLKAFTDEEVKEIVKASIPK